jgi:hypothetical protein
MQEAQSAAAEGGFYPGSLSSWSGTDVIIRKISGFSTKQIVTL